MTRPALILTLILLSACAAPTVNRAATNFDDSQFSIDLDHCRGGNIIEGTIKTMGAGAIGSLAGAGIVAVHGAAAAGSGRGAA